MPSQISDSQSDRNKADKMLLAIAVIIVAIAAAVLTAFVMLNEIHPYSTPKIEIIVDGNLTVNSGSYVYYKFTVLSEHVAPTVQGTFTVSGNDQKIRVYIMDSANFADWQDTRNASTYYDSGESNSGNITATLPVGNYDLVYDNNFSATSKNVTTQVHSWYLPN
jgi:hypothetical protein